MRQRTRGLVIAIAALIIAGCGDEPTAAKAPTIDYDGPTTANLFIARDGTVSDQCGPVPGIMVYYKDTACGSNTNENGFYAASCDYYATHICAGGTGTNWGQPCVSLAGNGREVNISLVQSFE